MRFSAQRAPNGHGVRSAAIPRLRGARRLLCTRRFEAVDPARDPAGVWRRFAVALAGREAALALGRRLRGGG